MTEKQFNDVLIDSGMIDKAGKVAENNDELKVNQKKLATLLDLYGKETRELGQTMWAAFNALTHWSTHLPDANKGGRIEKKQLDKYDLNYNYYITKAKKEIKNLEPLITQFKLF